MLVSQGYPGITRKEGDHGCTGCEGSIVFHAGRSWQTEGRDERGRVIAVSSFGKTMREALAQSYENVAKFISTG
ncbi:MAG: phosphoribosylglycinamide synthetase C domain-containing protein [Butyricimonas paravirosa]